MVRNPPADRDPVNGPGPLPWVSVVVPTYNGEPHLATALESIVRQDDRGVEVIVVDDGSTDGTLRIVDRYAGRLDLRVVRRPHSGNWVSNTNLGLSAASAPYACILHQDDYWLPGRLKTLGSLARRFPEALLLLHPSWYVDHAGRRSGRWTCPLPHGGRPLPPRLVVERLLVQNFVSMPAPLFRRQALLDLGGMDCDLWYTADWDSWLKLAARGPTLYHPEPLACFRIHGASQTVRSSVGNDGFRRQLETVLLSHLDRWEQRHGRVAPSVRRAARFSVEVNAALAAWFHGDPGRMPDLLRRALRLGPTASLRYLRDSRIFHRVLSRLRTTVGPAF